MSAALLERRISSALTNAATADHLSALISETESAIIEADATAKAERQKALDPQASPDLKTARAAMEDAQFARDRLRTVLPRLQQRHEEVTAAEYLVAWKETFSRLKIVRDEISEELSQYPDLVAKIANVFGRAVALDAELSRLHQARPAGVALHLLGAELMARGLEAFSAAQPSIASLLKLPDFTHSEKMVWPPSEAPMAAVMLPPTHLGPDWWRDAKRHGEQLREEAGEVAEYYDEQDRQREARQNNGR
jgi:hypothetical protein